jgi:hypothetical protein
MASIIAWKFDPLPDAITAMRFVLTGISSFSIILPVD